MTLSKFRVALAFFACLLAAGRSRADSQVRIVRLSDVEGGVQIDRGTHGFEKAFLNLPVTQGNIVRTQSDGRAEIQFEDGSALRLAPSTTLEVSQLSLSDSGARVSTLNLKSGTTYIDFKDSKNSAVTLTFGSQKIALTRPAHLRIALSETNAAVAVFKGEVSVQALSGETQVSKNRTAIFDLSGKDPAKIAREVESNPYDAWDKQQDQFQQRYGNDSRIANSSAYSYGAADMSYYGTYFNAPGYGLMWQPYFVSTAWDPFMDGGWAYYPGAGYGWVSAYPWGWMPYHSGSWAFVQGRGWAWQPGPNWTSINAQPRILNPPAGFMAPKAPAAAQGFVAVNRGPSPSFAGRSTNKLVIQNNSAGLGIPRGGINNLAKVSERSSTQGMVTARIHTAPVEVQPRNLSGYPGSSMGSATRGMSSASPESAQRGGAAPSRSAGPAHSAGPSIRSAPVGRGPGKN